jgi:two-component system, cell cycle response regulator
MVNVQQPRAGSIRKEFDVSKPKILLVDDTRLVLELEKSFLKFSEVEVLTAANGAEALEMIRKDPPNLVFMDMNMPVMDGLTACSTLKADPFLSDVPVVMLTTAGRDEDRLRAFQAGCDDYLTKPIDRREFLEKARRFAEAVDRREMRMPCHFPVLLLIGQSTAVAHAVDLSDGGVFLASHEKIPQHSQVKLAFYVPGGEALLMEVAGTVAWVNDETKRVKPSLPAGFGVEFVDLDEKGVVALKALLDLHGSSLSASEGAAPPP